MSAVAAAGGRGRAYTIVRCGGRDICHHADGFQRIAPRCCCALERHRPPPISIGCVCADQPVYARAYRPFDLSTKTATRDLTSYNFATKLNEKKLRFLLKKINTTIEFLEFHAFFVEPQTKCSRKKGNPFLYVSVIIDFFASARL